MSDRLPEIDAPNGAYRERPIDPRRTALLSVDMQNSEFSPERLARARAGHEAEARHPVLLERLAATVLPNQQRLQAAARAAGIEVVYTVIESLTRDGRDRSLDHKISRLHHPKGSWEAKVIADVAPVDDEILIPKTASGIFNATNIEYVLRNTIQTALTTENPTLFTMFDLLNDPAYRKKIVAQLDNKDLKNFWKNELGKAGGFQQVKMVAGITAKVGRFLFSASAKRILTRPPKRKSA